LYEYISFLVETLYNNFSYFCRMWLAEDCRDVPSGLQVGKFACLWDM